MTVPLILGAALLGLACLALAMLTRAPAIAKLPDVPSAIASGLAPAASAPPSVVVPLPVASEERRAVAPAVSPRPRTPPVQQVKPKPPPSAHPPVDDNRGLLDRN